LIETAVDYDGLMGLRRRQRELGGEVVNLLSVISEDTDQKGESVVDVLVLPGEFECDIWADEVVASDERLLEEVGFA